MAKYKVLSTKKISPRLIDEAKNNNIQIIEQEFISVQPIIAKEKIEEVLHLAGGRKEYFVFTSAIAVMPFDKHLNQYGAGSFAAWKIFCLEGKTKETVLSSLLPGENIVSTAKNAAALAEKIIEHGVKEITFFCGSNRRDDLPGILKKAGIVVHEIVVYETIEMPSAAPVDINGILFFSPSAVSSFFSVNKLNNKTVCFAIGQTTAHSIAAFTHNKVIVSESPSQERLVASMNFYFQNINRQE